MKYLTIIFLTVTLGTAHAKSESNLIELFSDSATVFIGLNSQTNVVKYDLDEILKIEERSSKGLSKNKVMATEQVKKRLSQELIQQILDASVGHVMANRYKLSYIPAIVINKKYVYYGKDVGTAISKWSNLNDKD